MKSIESVSVPADSRSYSSLMYRQWVKASAQTWASNCQKKPRAIFSLLMSLFSPLLSQKWIAYMSWENHCSLSTASSRTSPVLSPGLPLPGFSQKMGPPGASMESEQQRTEGSKNNEELCFRWRNHPAVTIPTSAYHHPPAHPHRHFTCCCKALIILLRGISLLYLSRYFVALQMLPKAILAVWCVFSSPGF